MGANFAPMIYRWSGEAMEPLPHFRRRCDQDFVIGEIYRLAPHEERSDISHSHQFAWLKQAWKTMPENLADLYPSPTHLRKRALIEAGYYTEEIVDCGTNAAALRVASLTRRREEFSLVIVRGPLVIIRDPKSQSYRAMDRKEFGESKAAIMEVVAALIGVSVDELGKNAVEAA